MELRTPTLRFAQDGETASQAGKGDLSKDLQQQANRLFNRFEKARRTIGNSDAAEMIALRLSIFLNSVADAGRAEESGDLRMLAHMAANAELVLEHLTLQRSIRQFVPEQIELMRMKGFGQYGEAGNALAAHKALEERIGILDKEFSARYAVLTTRYGTGKMGDEPFEKGMRAVNELMMSINNRLVDLKTRRYSLEELDALIELETELHGKLAEMVCALVEMEASRPELQE